LALLVAGAELFIRGAVRIARTFGVSPFVIGLTLVGFGTSAPELVVNISAALNDTTDIAVGNIVGSNVANIGLILGVAAVLNPVSAQMRLLRIELPIMLAASAGVWAAAEYGAITRGIGLAYLAGFVLVMAYLFRSAKEEPPEVKEEIGQSVPATVHRTWVSAVLLLIGLVGLVGGAELMVRSAVAVATEWGVSELIIGLTIVAVGTSLPELAATAAAAYRGESDIAVGNVVGSNIFNVLLILGATAQVAPLPIPDDLRRLDIPVMMAFSVALLLMLAKGLRVRRWQGALLLAAYAGYVAWQVSRAG
jgi:cation:H+ antiporter